MVAFTQNDEIIVGQEAKNQMPMNPENTIFGIKRLIGYNIDDVEIKKEKETWPFKIVKGTKETRAAVQVRYKGKDVIYTPEEISSLILSKIKNCANQSIEKPIERAVITVPAYFSSSQRQSTINAGIAAGLEQVDIISEPTAAAIAYGIGTVKKEKRTVFIFDFGGGTLDCTLMEIYDGHYNVIATSGDTHLGGEDIDIALADFIADEFKKQTNINVKEDKYKRNLALLKLECEKVKIALAAPGVSFTDTFDQEFCW